MNHVSYSDSRKGSVTALLHSDALSEERNPRRRHQAQRLSVTSDSLLQNQLLSYLSPDFLGPSPSLTLSSSCKICVPAVRETLFAMWTGWAQARLQCCPLQTRGLGIRRAIIEAVPCQPSLFQCFYWKRVPKWTLFCLLGLCGPKRRFNPFSWN